MISRGMSILSRGAEAVLLKGEFLGLEAVFKIRPPKIYRDPRLDARIRRERTLREARLLSLAYTNGIRVPILYYVDIHKGVIVEEYIPGKLLRDIVIEVDDDDVESLEKYFEAAGELSARLHSLGVVHGDLTISNMIVNDLDNTLYLIDFGIASHASDLEDIATDIHVFLRSLESIAPHKATNLFNMFWDKYSEVYGEDAARILELVHEIRQRGRYVARRQKDLVWKL